MNREQGGNENMMEITKHNCFVINCWKNILTFQK